MTHRDRLAEQLAEEDDMVDSILTAAGIGDRYDDYLSMPDHTAADRLMRRLAVARWLYEAENTSSPSDTFPPEHVTPE